MDSTNSAKLDKIISQLNDIIRGLQAILEEIRKKS